MVVFLLSFQIPTYAIFSTQPKWKTRKVNIEECQTIGQESFDDERYSFGNLNDITVSGNGNIIVVDAKTCRILKFSKEGRFLNYIGKGRGDGPGEIRVPWTVATDNHENVYVADHGSSKVHIFNGEGIYLDSFKTRHAPTSIAVDQDGCVYLGYWQFRPDGFYIHKYSPKGELLKKFCPPVDPKLSYHVEMSGYSGKLCLLSDGNLAYSGHYPYETRIFSQNGTFLKNFSRQIAIAGPPIEIKKENVVLTQGGCLIVKPASDGRFVTYCIIKNRNNDNFTYFFDIFDQDGTWLISVPFDSFKSERIRSFAIDKEGYFYFICHNPYPYIKKYRVIIT
jgi:hypothetical protein